MDEAGTELEALKNKLLDGSEERDGRELEVEVEVEVESKEVRLAALADYLREMQEELADTSADSR